MLGLPACPQTACRAAGAPSVGAPRCRAAARPPRTALLRHRGLWLRVRRKALQNEASRLWRDDHDRHHAQECEQGVHAGAHLHPHQFGIHVRRGLRDAAAARRRDREAALRLLHYEKDAAPILGAPVRPTPPKRAIGVAAWAADFHDLVGGLASGQRAHTRVWIPRPRRRGQLQPTPRPGAACGVLRSGGQPRVQEGAPAGAEDLHRVAPGDQAADGFQRDAELRLAVRQDQRGADGQEPGEVLSREPRLRRR
mmetsp:Transcript_17484/g.52565  ORF Transcript_17484/g.52565 Transcript_17484/m.52565 type:complete len:253 (-) Transcript_17484:652-1410(-)